MLEFGVHPMWNVLNAAFFMGGAMSTVLASPTDVCTCGHLKIYHAYLNYPHRTGKGSPSSCVVFAECGKEGCSCTDYIAKQVSHD